MIIDYEKEILEYLGIPSVPKKRWDGKSAFKDGVAVVRLSGGFNAYAVATCDGLGVEPRVKKVFTDEPFSDIVDIFPVPSYMNSDVETMDLDEQSKINAQSLLDEAGELEKEVVHDVNDDNGNEYFFPDVRNDDEAVAFIKSYNEANGIKAGVPKSHDGIVARLAVIWSDTNNTNNKG